MSGPPVWTRDMEASLRQLLLLKQERLSYRRIAAVLTAESGVPLSAGAISGKVNRMGLSDTRPRFAPPRPRPAMPTATLSATLAAPETDVPQPNCSLLELLPDSCRWPLSIDAAGGYVFCGQIKQIASYCALHAGMAYVKVRHRIEQLT